MRLIDADKVEAVTFEEPSYSDPVNILTEIREKIRELPTVDTITSEEGYEMYGKGYLSGYERGKEERNKGDWIMNQDENPECPFCHHSFIYWSNFCPTCGADLR